MSTVLWYAWFKDWLKLALCLLIIASGIYLDGAGYGRGLYVRDGIEYLPESTWETYQHRSYLYDGPRRICAVGERTLLSPSSKFVIFDGLRGVELFSRSSGRVTVAPNVYLESCSWDESNNRAKVSVYDPKIRGVSARKRLVTLP